MEIHELNTFSGTLGSSDFFATDNGNDTSKVSAEAMFAPLNARIDNIIAGPAPSAQEITDARRGADGVTYPSLGAAIRDQVAALQSDLEYTAEGIRSSKFRLPLSYIDSTGTIVASGVTSGQYAYDLICYEVEFYNNIREISATAPFIYGFFTSKPALGSVTYNASRSSSGGTTLTNVIIPNEQCKWIAIRVQHDDGDVSVDVDSYMDAFGMIARAVVTSGDMNDLVKPGFYVHQAGTNVANAPDTGGSIFVGRMGGTVTQIYIANRASNEGKFYIRKIVNETVGNWFVYYASSGKRAKIAFFGDSIIWGAIKTLTNGSFVTSQANPTIPQTMASILGCTVSNFAVGGMGYITEAEGQNILAKIKDTDLTGYTHVLISAGDNDSSVGLSGIGSYTDTGTNTILGQMYNIITYLHNNYPNIKPILVEKNNKMFTTPDGVNKTYFGTFPNYYYGYTYSNGFSISKVHEEMEKFCDYYHVGYISQNNISGGYNLQAMVGVDGTHYSQSGYNSLGEYLAGQVSTFIG